MVEWCSVNRGMGCSFESPSPKMNHHLILVIHEIFRVQLQKKTGNKS